MVPGTQALPVYSLCVMKWHVIMNQVCQEKYLKDRVKINTRSGSFTGRERKQELLTEKGGGKMNHDGVIAYEIRNYTRLQRIKAASNEVNEVLEYEIRESEAVLHSLGINTDDLKK